MLNADIIEERLKPDDFIEINREGEMVIITMRGGIRYGGLQNAVKSKFTGLFM